MNFGVVFILIAAWITLRSDEQISGGLSSGMPDSAFDPIQLKAGTEVELEHTNSRLIAKEIAKDHLAEDPSYYKKLAKMERQ